MTTYGLTETGFLTKRLEDIKAELEAALREDFGDIDVSTESVFGQLIGAHAEIAALVWEQLENIYNAMYPNSAEGTSLDNVCQLLGITRLPSTSTKVNAVLYGDPTTIISAGNAASVNGQTPRYILSGDITLSGDDKLSGLIQVDDEDVAGGWDVTIEGTAYHVDNIGGMSKEDVAEAIYDELIVEAAPVIPILNEDTVSFVATDPTIELSVLLSTGLSFTKIGRIGLFSAETTGANVVVEDTLDTIETPVSGWDSINNYEAGVTGRAIETDDALRTRRLASIRANASCNLEAMRSRILADVEDVTQCMAFENESDIGVDGRPPHSFEMIIAGGTKQDIADKIWEIKPAGIQSFGNIGTVDPPVPVAVDSQGTEHPIYFSRPINVYAHIDIVLTLFDEETFPDDGEATIAANILAYGNTIGIGKDILIQRFYGEIFKVPGIQSAVIRTAITPNPGDTPTYGTVDIVIDPTEVSVWASDRIHVSTP